MLNSKPSAEIIPQLRIIFATRGILLISIAVNMPFNSMECQKLNKDWNFEIITNSPLYPQLNGLAEKAAGIAKETLKKAIQILS